MQTVLVVLHLFICLALIIIVLLQTGKGSEIGAVFGSSSQTLFGPTGGGTFFGKLTSAVAIIFLITSLILASRSSRITNESVMTGVKPSATAPATTGGESTTDEGVAHKETPDGPEGAVQRAKPTPPTEATVPQEPSSAPVAGEKKTD
jgi:preprotein translocase subunit SecG